LNGITAPSRSTNLATICIAVLATAVITRGAESIPDKSESDEGADLFLQQVLPMLSSRCVSCHGVDKQKGGLRLDSRPALLKGGETGPAVVPGNPATSLLVSAIRHDHDELQMPPKEKLTDKQVAAVVRWVELGAAWPHSAKVSPVVAPVVAKGERIGDAWTDARNPIRRLFNGERLDLWSLKPPATAPPPAASSKARAYTPVDNFILASLESHRLAPSPEADRRTLIRRVFVDLVGLPPTPEEVDAFVKDTDARAYETLVDRLLASPHYGERWARYWLDLVRYADTDGFELDEFRTQAWRYRDYVIRAFNADKPYDQFIKEQLAGDEMLAGQPAKTPADVDKIVATGFLRLGPVDATLDVKEKDKGRDQFLADVVNTTGAAFLGVTLSCCQCHDHKYDPLAQADHYRMRAFFAAVQPRDDISIDPPDEQAKIKAHNAPVDAAIEQHRGEVKTLLANAKAKFAEKRKADPTKRATASDVNDGDALNEDPSLKPAYDELAKKIGELKKQKRTFTTALAATDSGALAPPTNLLFQGDYLQPRDAVEPGFLSVFDPNPASVKPISGASSTGRRTALANWIASKDNPLTARVMVNRIWQGHFGRGIVATANDFGYPGDRPTHPELLDWLARDFVEHGWSIKHVHRRIVLSATYRQSSLEDATAAGKSADPDNLLLWRQNPRRLDAETLRDTMLAVSGKLLPADGGKPRWPPVAEELLKSQPAIFAAMDGQNPGKLQGWYADPLEQTDVRSIFLVQKRSLPVPFLQLFDLPDGVTTCARRTTTTVAPQALTLLNSETTLRLARALAERVTVEKKPDAPKDVVQLIRRTFELTLLREPDAAELEQCRSTFERHVGVHRDRLGPGIGETDAKLAALTDVCRALINVNEFMYID
jgi:mono/diheme cytochrome c family protein